MSEPNEEAWKDQYSGRERVRMVVETLDEPETVTTIADRADVAWATADSELENLVAENKAEEHTVDGQTKFAPNPVQILIEEVLDLISENSRDELESALVEHTAQVESLREEYEVETLSELHNKLVEEDLTTEEMRSIRNAASTWEALETEIRLSKHALQLYTDVTQLSDSDGDEGLAIA
jgi:predicted transcriptional regulator